MEQLKKCNPLVIPPTVISGPSGKIEIRSSAIHGHGIFSREKISAGELIEEAKLLKLSWRTKIIQDSILANYAWLNDDCTCDQCKIEGKEQYLSLGYGSIYNHAKNPNTAMRMDFVSETVRIYSTHAIEKDEEIFVSYGPQYWIIREFWKKVINN
jgi:SET domain-containing protein